MTCWKSALVGIVTLWTLAILQIRASPSFASNPLRVASLTPGDHGDDVQLITVEMSKDWKLVPSR
jgi:hypothetical protein